MIISIITLEDEDEQNAIREIYRKVSKMKDSVTFNSTEKELLTILSRNVVLCLNAKKGK